MTSVCPLAQENVWFDKPKYDLAEKKYYERLAKGAPTQNGNSLNSLAGEVAKARQHIKNSLQCIDDIANMTSPSAVIEVSNRLNSLEKENTNLKLKVGNLTALLAKLEIRVKELETGNKSVGMQAVAQNSTVASQAVAKAANAASQASANVKTAGSQAQSQPAKQEDDDDGVDLFASDSEEDEEANKIKEQRLAEYAAKKSKKPALIAKSSIILDIKPWDDETDMKEMERRVRLIEADGLLWGASKLVPLAYGIHKLQINCVVEDDKISVDWLQETIEEIEDYVQSVDIAAFNKI
uniref:Elongation factor 1delta n=1 Tax=Adelphocoris suturalis TaxID=323751 RepID=A0A2D1QW71_9HEMI|nr:elongation factor 1delta [Adelphocoris suturalis]